MQGKLSSEQLNTYRNSFKLFDTSAPPAPPSRNVPLTPSKLCKGNKGIVTKEELAKLLGKLGAAPSDEELTDMIHEVTGVKGGDKITFDQFVEMMVKRGLLSSERTKLFT